MEPSIKKLYFMSFFVAVLIVCISSVGEAQPALYGKILLIASSGEVPLRNASVELLVPGKKETRATTYSDSWGNFAFYNITNGTYEIQILMGRKIMKQRIGNSFMERQRVQVSGRGTRVPDIFVGPD